MPRRKNRATSYKKFVYTLKIRWEGEEDEVFVFSSTKKAKDYVFEYFRADPDDMSWSNLVDALEMEDIGYFDIQRQEIR